MYLLLVRSVDNKGIWVVVATVETKFVCFMKDATRALIRSVDGRNT